jgi:hypothetical protein
MTSLERQMLCLNDDDNNTRSMKYGDWSLSKQYPIYSSTFYVFKIERLGSFSNLWKVSVEKWKEVSSRVFKDVHIFLLDIKLRFNCKTGRR